MAEAAAGIVGVTGGPMKFTIDASKFRTPLAHVFAATSGRNNAMFANALCVASTNAIGLRGTDGEVSVSVLVPAEVDGDGICLLPPKLVEIVKASGDGVTVESGKTLTVVSNGDTYELASETADGFPELAAISTPSLTTTAGELLTAIECVAFAASKDEGKYAVKCVCWDFANGKASLAATDGKRLAVADLAGEIDEDGSYLMSPRATTIAAKMLAECDGESEVMVSFSKSAANVTTSAGSVWSRLVEGRFPPYRDIIPKKGKTIVELDMRAFVGAVRRAALTADDESKRVTLAFDDGKLVMSAASATVGQSTVTHTPVSMNGPSITMAFDPYYLADLSHGPDRMTLEMTDAGKSAVWRAEGLVYLVVPLV